MIKMEQDFNLSTIKLADDFEGKVVATLISSKHNAGNRRSVLYVHGYIDYFFHAHLCEAFIANNFDFYAIDLRKYGRSILSHQTPNYCEHINEYFEEITAAINEIRSRGNDPIYLLGHSTGGLITSCYLNDGAMKDEVSGLILNSPFLDMPQSYFVKNGMYAIAKLLSKVKGDGKTNMGLSPIYAKTVHKDHYGQWDFNLEWKPINGFPTYFKWIIAIIDAQRRLKEATIQVPILLMHSTRSIKANKYAPEVLKADIVLNVNDMQRIGPHLGKQVTMKAIENGQHDLFLSAKQVRKKAMAEMFSWLER